MNGARAREELEAAVHKALSGAWRDALRHVARYLDDDYPDLAADIRQMQPVGTQLAQPAREVMSRADVHALNVAADQIAKLNATSTRDPGEPPRVVNGAVVREIEASPGGAR